LAKIGLKLPFRNKQNVPQDVDESNLTYLALFTACQWARKYYRGLKGAKIVARGVRWYILPFRRTIFLLTWRRDSVTEDQTPLISWHPDYKNLGLAWGASFTRTKDFPTISRKIYEILFLDHPFGEYG
jgi:hypothetical protein